jgi:plasmid maintenance system killer protein
MDAVPSPQGWPVFGMDENYRVTFTFENGHAYEVDYEDYR